MMIVAGVVIGLLALLIRGNATLASIDSSAAEWGNRPRDPRSRPAAHRVTYLGDTPSVR